MQEGINIHIQKTHTLWENATKALIDKLISASNNNRKILLLLSGGSVVEIYKRIKYYVSSSKYENLAIGQIDERFQPKKVSSITYQVLSMENEDTNAYQIKETGLWEACREKSIPYYLISQEGTLIEAVQKYNEQVKDLFEHFSYKIGVLGIGEDGHTAGLLPGYKKIWNKESYVIGYDLRQNEPRDPFCPGGFCFRISLTPKALSQLDHGIVVAIGEKKRGAIEKAMDPINLSNLNKYPAAILQKIKKVDLFTDMDLI